MTTYFYDCKTAEEAKSKYRNLAKVMHPDKGGDTKTFQEMQTQYDNYSEYQPQQTYSKFEQNTEYMTKQRSAFSQPPFGRAFAQGTYQTFGGGKVHFGFENKGDHETKQLKKQIEILNFQLTTWQCMYNDIMNEIKEKDATICEKDATIYQLQKDAVPWHYKLYEKIREKCK